MQTTIRSLGSSGEGVGQDEEGKTLFIEGALPGERVTYTITDEKKSYAKGQLLEILEPSKERVTPPCPIFGECGGCHIQHLSYPAQLEVKRQKVVDALQRIAKMDVEVAPCLPSPMPLHYRNKIQLPHRDGQIGLFRKHSHEIIPLKSCYIQCALGEKIYAWMKDKLPKSVRHLLIRNAIFNHEALVVLVSDGKENFQKLAKAVMDHFEEVKGVVLNINLHSNNRILGSVFKTLAGRPYIIEKLAGLSFKLSAPSFFQVNSWQAEHLFAKATSLIEQTDHVIDAFCGVGTLALFAARKAKTVSGFEVVEEAILDARENARLNHISNCRFEVGRAEKQELSCDTLLLNPPRKGLDPAIFDKIDARKIVYISCDPATLARDLPLFKKFKTISAQPIDMFPQTMHVETILTLQ